MLEGIRDHRMKVGTAPLCNALEVSRASVYRSLKTGKKKTSKHRRQPKQALTESERREVLDILHSKRFVDKAPAEVYASLLDEGTYHCSVRTMYRILESEGEVRERRNLINHRNHKKPELLATKPNELWSWDITKLCGPAKWTYFYLYVILDVFSRYVVGWMVAHRESSALANRLIYDTCEKQEICKNQLTLHADRGPSMKSKCVAMLLSDLGVTKTHSRPYVSNDNPFSESHFKTLKYRPNFPRRFGCIQDARTFLFDFFEWYNKEHNHSGIGWLTPETVHHDLAEQVIAGRQATLEKAYQKNPERFKKLPKPPELPKAVWINPPENLEDKLFDREKEVEICISGGIEGHYHEKMLFN